MQIFTFRVEFEKEEDGRYSAYVPALPGCHSWGATLEEARANMAEALRSHVASLLDHGDSVPVDGSAPPVVHEETFTVAV
ncbi:MAG: type II toxin-antitoxin system HicB family antitoxin [Actinomycetota bacterium]|nr:type II toxin-antitoxin system HicB family antitoxin [Actinomycetota bacterium]